MRQYAIYDMITEEYSPLDGGKNNASAIRKFEQFIEGQPEKVKNDFSLWYICEYDINKGEITNNEPKEIYPIPAEKEEDWLEKQR